MHVTSRHSRDHAKSFALRPVLVRAGIDAPALGQPPVRRYGGVGAMIAGPGITLKLTPAEHLEVAGPLASRAAQFARQATRALGVDGEPACRIEIELRRVSTSAWGPVHS